MRGGRTSEQALRQADVRQVNDLRCVGRIATRNGMLTVACSRRERRGHYRLDTLIGRHSNTGMVVQPVGKPPSHSERTMYQ